MLDMNIDFVTNTITLTKAFHEAAKVFGSEEYTKLQLVVSDNPNMKVVVRTTRSGNRKCDYKGLTYEYMRKFREGKMNFISRAENPFSIIIESQYYEEVIKDGNND